MDLGTLADDHELEQADRLQKQALQLLRHAANARMWTSARNELQLKPSPSGDMAKYPEPHPTFWCSFQLQKASTAPAACVS